MYCRLCIVPLYRGGARVLHRGGGGQNCQKSLSGGWGGTRPLFSDFNFFYGVGVLSWTWPTAELTSKKKKIYIYISKTIGGGATAPLPPPPPPWRRHWCHTISNKRKLHLLYNIGLYAETKYQKYQQNIERNSSFRMWKCENFLSSLAPLARHIHSFFSMSSVLSYILSATPPCHN